MADTEQENSIGVVDRRRTQNQVELPGNLGSQLWYVDVGSLRSALAASSGYYTNARLNEMTKNDMVYAMRTIQDAAGI